MNEKNITEEKIFDKKSGKYRTYKHLDYKFYINDEELQKKKSNYFIIDNISCTCCGKLFSRNTKSIRNSCDKRKGKEWEKMMFCSITCFNKTVSSFPSWKKENSEAQLIAQNKPEQKKKNSEGVKRWRSNPENQKKWIDSLSFLYTDEYREKQRQGTLKRWQDPEYRKMMDGVTKGHYHTACHGIFHSKISGDIHYESSYELLFLFLKDLENKVVERFDLKINYYYNNRERNYYPDFICEDVIYEIKSHTIANKDIEEIKVKKEAAESFVNDSDIYKGYKLFFEEDFGKEIINCREYVYTWLLQEKYIDNVYGGKYMIKHHNYTENYNNDRFLKAKELYLKWISLK